MSKPYEGQVFSQAIRKHTVELLECVTFGTVVDQLYAKELIDDSVYETAINAQNTTQDKGRKILCEVQKKVKANSKLFGVFCDILASNETTAEISKRLRDSVKVDKSVRDITSQTASLAIAPESKPEERTELTELKESLVRFTKELSKMKGQVKDNMLTCIKSIVSDYIDNAFRSGISESTIHQHIYNLCHHDMLIPSDLTTWASQQVDAVSKETIPKIVPQSTDMLCPSQKFKALFSDEIVYHSMVCCNAVTSYDKRTCKQYLETVRSGHLFREVSMTDTSAHQYLIARIQDRKLLYVAFKSELNISKWSDKCTFEEGIQKQMDQIPVRFFVEQLKDQWEIVLTGFSFGGMLACYVAASIWNSSAISPEEFKCRVICITFGQPLIAIPYVEEIIKTSHEFQDSIHLIYSTNDVIPRLLRIATNTKNQMEKTESKSLATAAVQALQQTTASVCLRNLGILQEQQCEILDASIADALAGLKSALNTAVPVAAMQDSGSHLLKASCYTISLDKLVEIDKDKAFDELSYFSPSSVAVLTENVFKEHSMATFNIKTYKVPSSTIQQIPEVDILKPRIDGVAFHCYGSSEVAVIVLGDQLWFCYEISLGEGEECRKINTPAQHITRKSIQFNYTPSENHDISTSCNKIKVVLYSHFCEPIDAVVEVKKKVYACTLRQAQLAKHTPTEVIQLAYLCAMLEQPTCRNSRRDHSERYKKTVKFLEEAVKVVPIESIFYAIAYGDNDVALKCSKALEERKPSIPSSEMVIIASQYAATRIITGCHKQFIDQVDFQIRTMNVRFHSSLCFPVKLTIEPSTLKLHFQYNISCVPLPMPIPVATKGSRKAAKMHGSLYSDVARSSQTNKPSIVRPQIVHVPSQINATITIPIPPKDENSITASSDVVQHLHKMSEDAYNYGCSKIVRHEELPLTCGLNINEVYQTSSKSEFVLSSPTKVLSDARCRLSELVTLASKESKGIPPSVFQDKIPANDSSTYHNLEMLKTINNVRTEELNLCTTLLSAFMEQQIRIPLINSSPLETASVLSTSAAPVAVGVWALFSLKYGDIKEMLTSLHGKPLMVDITNYIMGIYNSNPLKMEDARYAGKLQFLLQGMNETISCNSQYVSYSLERQLVDLCNKRLKSSNPLSTNLEDVIAKWDTIFCGDALSLVAIHHRSLIARWLKWALMIHQLREKLAEYTAIGVIGLTNSGKSLLVNKLFGVESLVGTTQMKRTTVPLMYSINGAIKKLDVIDFPGVDDQDETIPQLAKLLLGLAQVVIFVIDYRKIHTQSAKSWLTELESEKEAVPILVCLTHVDRLYAEIMAQNNNSKDSVELCKRYIRNELNQVKERLGYSPSRDVGFYSFSQEPDSSLNNDKGLKILNNVGIQSVKDVGNWVVEKLKSHLDQQDLAEKLQEHFQKTTRAL